MITWKDFMNLRVFKQLRFKQGAVLGILHSDQVDEDVLASKLGTRVIDVTTATITILAKLHAGIGRVVTFNRAAGITATLPASTGSGDAYRFVIGTAATGNQIVKVANATDVMTGRAVVSQDAADTVAEFEAAATSDTITLNGTTTGGGKGSSIELIDIAAGLWWVNVRSLTATGTEATPFSATVS